MPVLSTLGAAIANVYGFTSGLIKDQYFNLVSLLLPGNGTNGATNNSFVDSSTANGGTGWPITRNGDTTQGTFSPFSQTGWGSTFSGSNQLTLPSALALAPEAGQFCIEFWIYPTASWGSTDKPIFVAAGSGGLWVGWQATVFVLRAYGVTNHLTYATAPSLNTWTHVAICRNSGNTTSMYFNGSRVATGTVTQNFAQAVSYIASDSAYGAGGAALLMASSLSNLRLVKGSSVYDPTQSTITVPTSPLTAITNTTLLTCQSNRFIDNSIANSGSGWTVTPNGSPSVTPFSPFAPTSSYSAAAVGGSGYFDSAGDNLTIADATALDLGTGNFTLEAWIYLSVGGAGTFRQFFSKYTGGVGIEWYVSNANKLECYFNGGAGQITSTGNINVGSWYHVALVREGTGAGQTKFYINGSQDGSSQANVNVDNAASLVIGESGAGSNDYWGYIANMRVVKGTAVYTGNFTPPTKPLATSGADSAGSYPSTTNVNTSFASSATSLLLNFTNAGVVDATAKNVLETEGNAQISTAQSKWGGGSILLDGTGDYLNVPTTPLLSLGSAAFTIEMWVNFSASVSGAGYVLVSKAPNSFTPQASWNFWRNTSNKLRFIFSTDGGATNLGIIDTTNNFTPTTGQWYYLAVTRSGSTWAIYIDGVSQSLTTSTTGSATLSSAIFNSTTPLVVGATSDGVSTLNGYVDDLRITTGVARTITASPTAPFPLQ